LAAPSTDGLGVTALAETRPAPLEALQCATGLKASALAREGYETGPAGH
jgi:hypothetical protein